MRKKAILFVEFKEKVSAIAVASEAGYATVLVTSRVNPLCFELFDEVFEVDLMQQGVVDQLIADLNQRFDVRGVLSNYEDFVVQRSYLAERLGLPTTSVYGACCTRNKVMQREALAGLKENIEYHMVNNYDDALKVFAELGGDIYLKSIAGIKSRYVFHVKSEDELKRAWQKFEKASNALNNELYNDFSYLDFEFEYPNPAKNLLIEKAYYGQQIAISSFVSSDQIFHAPSLTDVYSAKDINVDDSFLAFRILPSRLSVAQIERAKLIVEKVVKTLGLKNCGLHTELILTADGDFKLIEIASRLGGYRAFMYREVYNFILSDCLVHSALDLKIETINNEAMVFVSMMEIFPRNSGLLVGIEGFEDLSGDEMVSRIKKKAEIGEKVGLAREDYAPVLTFLIKGSTYEEVYERSLYYQVKLKILTK